MGLGDGDHLIAGAEHEPGAGNDLFPGRSQRRAPGLAFDQLDSKVVLQLLQLGGQRRLADETARGGLPEVAGIGHCHQVAQVLELDV